MTKKHNQAVTQDNDQDLQDLQKMLDDVKADKDEEDMVEKLQNEIKKITVTARRKRWNSEECSISISSYKKWYGNDSASVSNESWIHAPGFTHKNRKKAFTICRGFA